MILNCCIQSAFSFSFLKKLTFGAAAQTFLFPIEKEKRTRQERRIENHRWTVHKDKSWAAIPVAVWKAAGNRFNFCHFHFFLNGIPNSKKAHKENKILRPLSFSITIFHFYGHSIFPVEWNCLNIYKANHQMYRITTGFSRLFIHCDKWKSE